jgi:hypothetical protein
VTLLLGGDATLLLGGGGGATLLLGGGGGATLLLGGGGAVPLLEFELGLATHELLAQALDAALLLLETTLPVGLLGGDAATLLLNLGDGLTALVLELGGGAATILLETAALIGDVAERVGRKRGDARRALPTLLVEAGGRHDVAGVALTSATTIHVDDGCRGRSRFACQQTTM